MNKTLFLNPPSFDGFDGGAGARYQARREVTSYWYPTWLAQPAALVPGSRLIDAPPAGIKLEEILPLANDYELARSESSQRESGSGLSRVVFCQRSDVIGACHAQRRNQSDEGACQR